MSYSEISCSRVRGRKKYSCEWCPQDIEKGEEHISRAYKFYGEFQSGRMHLDCFQAMQKSDHGVVSDGWLPSSNFRGEPLL